MDTLNDHLIAPCAPAEPVCFTSCDGPHSGIPDDQRPPHWLDAVVAGAGFRGRHRDDLQQVATDIANAWAGGGFTAADLAAYDKKTEAIRAGQAKALRRKADLIEAGKVDDPSLFFFGRWAGPEHDDLSTVELRMAAVADATGPIGEFGPGQYERIAKDYDRRGVDKAYWERVYLNRWRQGGSQAFNMVKVSNLFVDQPIPDGAFVAAGFDGAKFRDATALVITDIETGWQQLLGLWERPELADEWEVPFDEVDQVVDDMMSRFEVWRMACDPPFWTAEVAGWAQRYADRVIEWHTVRKRPMADACRAYAEAVEYVDNPETAEIRFAANPWRDDLVRHMGNAGRRELSMVDDKGQPLWVMQKQEGRLEDKFDAAMAGCLSWTTCLDARRSGARPKPKAWLPRRLR